MGAAVSTTPFQALQAALRGRPERPLVVPIASAVVGELQALGPEAVLADPGKLSMLVREVAVSLGADAAVAEFGTFWDAEALGMSLDWSRGFPPLPRGRIAAAATLDLERAPRARVVLEVVRRLRALLDGPLCAAGITGPAALSRLCGGDPPVDALGPLSLAAVRALCEAGAQVVFVVEEADPPPDPSAYAAALAPLWATIRFYGALGVLHLAGDADAWAPVLEREGPFLPCFDPEASPGLASLVAGRSFGLALPPRPVTARARGLASSSRCVLLTHTRELAGVVPGRALASCGAELRGAAA